MQLHTWEDRWLNDERLPRAIENMKKSGKVRAFGPSMNRWEPSNGIRAVLEGQVIERILNSNSWSSRFSGGKKFKIAFVMGSLSGERPAPMVLWTGFGRVLNREYLDSEATQLYTAVWVSGGRRRVAVPR